MQWPFPMCGKKVAATEHTVQKQDKDDTPSPIWGVIFYVYPRFISTLSLGLGKSPPRFTLSREGGNGEVCRPGSTAKDQVWVLPPPWPRTSGVSAVKENPCLPPFQLLFPFPSPNTCFLNSYYVMAAVLGWRWRCLTDFRKCFFSAWASWSESKRSS